MGSAALLKPLAFGRSETVRDLQHIKRRSRDGLFGPEMQTRVNFRPLLRTRIESRCKKSADFNWAGLFP